mmetsp:Transcript_40555/g.121219  ORF Transcript_40555/g.121219 Transcript_40555/m.121219 type:complete len:329 (+) Transcript_40555:128-1114(+)
MTLASDLPGSGQRPVVMAATNCQEGDAERKATAELSRHCHELTGLLSLWREGYSDLHGALWELLQMAQPSSGQGGGRIVPYFDGLGTSGAEGEDKAASTLPGTFGAPRLDRFREPQEEACPEFTSLAIQLGPSPRRGSLGLEVAGTEYVVARGGGDSPRGSDDGSSSSFDLEVDEEYSRRIGEMEGKRRDRYKYEEDDEDDEDNPVLYSSPLLFENFLQSRLMARVAIGEGLRALIDKSWCQILFRIDEGEDEDGEGPPAAGREREDRESSGESSRESSVDGAWANRWWGSCGPGQRFPASFRLRGPPTYKEDGPLQKLLDQELMESE